MGSAPFDHAPPRNEWGTTPIRPTPIRHRGGNPVISSRASASAWLSSSTALERARTGPHDLVGRDAEYYLKARSMIAASHGVLKVPYAVGGTGLSLLYNGIKAVAIGFGFEEQTRTDPDVPVTPPGGNVWVIKGSVDGISDDGSKVGIPAHAKLVD